MISAVIPAYNEEERISKVLEETSKYVDEIVVVDDASTDDTAKIAKEFGKVLENENNLGYITSIKKGFRKADGNIIVTLDADGEHDPSFIPKLVEPIKEGEFDIVFGRRKNIPRFSERFLSKLIESKVEIHDSGTGFRALKRDVAKNLDLNGYCTCGIFALEAYLKGYKMKEVLTPTRKIDKPKNIAWKHFLQFFIVLRLLIRASTKNLFT